LSTSAKAHDQIDQASREKLIWKKTSTLTGGGHPGISPLKSSLSKPAYLEKGPENGCQGLPTRDSKARDTKNVISLRKEISSNLTKRSSLVSQKVKHVCFCLFYNSLKSYLFFLTVLLLFGAFGCL